MALRYNDQSPLENHHCSTLLSILHQFHLLSSLTRHQRAYVRKLIIELIISTDLARHDELNLRLAQMPPLGEAPISPADRTCLLQGVLHAADFYSPTLPWRASVQLVKALGCEF